MDLGIALEGFFFEKVNGSTGQWVKRHFFGADDTGLSLHSCKRRLLLCCAASKSLIRAKGTFCCTASQRVYLLVYGKETYVQCSAHDLEFMGLNPNRV